MQTLFLANGLAIKKQQSRFFLKLTILQQDIQIMLILHKSPMACYVVSLNIKVETHYQ